MNAHARIATPPQADRGLSIDSELATIGEIAATLSAPVAISERFRGALALLAGLGLTEGGVATLDGRYLRGLAGRQAEAPPQSMTPRITAFFAGGETGLLRREHPPTLGAPIRVRGEIVGLLAARVKGRAVADADLRLLSLVANLLGPLVLRALSGESGLAPQPAPDAKAIVGTSPALHATLDQARLVAPTNLPVLLRGESGVGKELFAQFIHDHSPRAEKHFIKVNCAALPDSLLESELFGHERGAFTGAKSRREGRFALANGGTILLDEIGDVSIDSQAKLLRVLQEGEFERVGGTKTLRVNVRVIAASNRDLEAAVRAKKFHADLYYRLCVAQVSLPSLRERSEDIPALAKHILARFNAENGLGLALHPRAETMLGKCAFPGNIRELENCLRSAAALTQTREICESDFACRQGRCFSARLRRAQVARARQSS